jgi:hypothetical protein
MSRGYSQPIISAPVIYVLLALICVYLFYPAAILRGQTKEFPIFDAELSPGFDMGADSSERVTGWLIKENGYMKIAYPKGQDWGAVFITVGKPKRPPRPFKDFSAFETLTIEMKGEVGGEQIEIGVKTNKQPDDGSEVKLPAKLTTQWQTYTFPLSKFKVDLSHLYVVTEFVFSAQEPQTVYFRKVKFTSGGATAGNINKSGATIAQPSPTQTPGAVEKDQTAPTILSAFTSTIASWIFGSLLLLVLIGVLFFRPNLSADQRAILRLLMALAAGFFAIFFVGGVLLNGTLMGLALSATGGFVLFILIQFIFDPFAIRSKSTSDQPLGRELKARGKER